ncbi:MAG: DUF2171 domain-containing protein [Pseudomonadota bacterium]
MISSNQVKPDMPVVCSKDGQFAVVDHMEGTNTIKLQKDKTGQHHYIPLSWVKSVDNGKVKVDRPGDQAMKEWATEPANVKH